MQPPANLGPRQARLRFGIGLGLAAVTAGLATWFLVTRRPPPWFAALVVPSFFAALGLLQGTAKT